MEVIMSGNSTLDPDNMPRGRDRQLGRGHGSGALGPSDSSDSGSDLLGGSGLAGQVDPDLALGHGGDTAGPDIGDADLDSDTDAGGTGERAAAGRDSVPPDGSDIGVDHIESLSLPIGLEHDDVESALQPGKREHEDVERGP
jgi:hypothetical protein